jgi:hypothetical protein
LIYLGWLLKDWGFDVISYFQFFGIILMTLGILLFIAPVLLERMPSLEKVPWIILYVYRSDSFTFVTSPILIIISILSFLGGLIFKIKS